MGKKTYKTNTSNRDKSKRVKKDNRRKDEPFDPNFFKDLHRAQSEL